MAWRKSTTIAERAAWDFIGTDGGDTQLVVVNPTFIAGPSLVAALRSTLTGFKAIIEGTMPALPRQRFGVVDVRDVADAHITAMATPAAAGKRYLLLAEARRSPGWGWHRSSAPASGLQASTSQPTRRPAKTRRR
jgi:nucleoside-diphosphate-sugar epimerase